MPIRFREYWKKYDIWFLVGFALLLRLLAFSNPSAVAYAEFFRDYFVVSGLIHGRMIVLLGPSSILGGFHFGPFYYYWLAIFTSITGGSAYGLILCSAVTSALSVYALFRLVQLWSDRRDAAWVAALLCTFSMYAINMASYVSNPNFLPLFVIWFFYCLTKMLRGEGGMMNALWLGLSFGIATQLHVTALVVLSCVSLVTLAIFRPGHSFKKIAVAAGAGIVSYLPYLWYEITHRFSDFTRLAQLGAEQLGGAAVQLGEPISSGGLSNIHTIASFFSVAWLPIQNVNYAFTSLSPQWLGVLVAVAAVAFIVYFLYVLLHPGRRKAIEHAMAQPMPEISKEGMAIIMSWIIASIAMLLIYRHYARYYYAIILWPTPIILLVYASFWLRKHFGIGHALAILFVIFGAIQIISFEAVPHHWIWTRFYQEYAAQYEHDSNILEIGAPGHEGPS